MNNVAGQEEAVHASQRGPGHDQHQNPRLDIDINTRRINTERELVIKFTYTNHDMIDCDEYDSCLSKRFLWRIQNAGPMSDNGPPCLVMTSIDFNHTRWGLVSQGPCEKVHAKSWNSPNRI